MFGGINRDNQSMILAGALAIAALAAGTDTIPRILERLTPTARAQR